MPNSISENEKVREHLANERTFLAWIRTSIALMGFGFVIVKFAVFIRQAVVMLGENTVHIPKANSARIGVGMVALGAVVAALSYFSFLRTKKLISEGTYTSGSGMNLFVTLVIVLACILLLVYLAPSLT